MSDLIELGRVVGIYGVRGWVKIFSYASPRENILNYSPWLLHIDAQYIPFKLKQGRRQGKGIVAQLEGIDDRDAARDFIDTPLFIQRTQLHTPRSGEYYWHDLVGLEVINLDDIALGTVSHLLETGANDVMVINDATKERLIPFTLQHAVHKVDLDKKLIIVDWDPDF